MAAKQFQFDSQLLHHVKFGPVDIAKSMLNEDLAKASDETTNTLLHYAVLGKSDQIVQHLIELGAEVNCPGKDGNTPLKLAIERVNRPVVDLLDILTVNGVTAFRKGMELKCLSTKILELLLNRLRAKVVDPELLVDELVAAGFNILLCVVYLRDVPVIRCMLQRGFDVNPKDHFGRTALQIACSHEGVELVKLLIDYGADVNALDQDRHGPLWSAASYGNKHTMKLLLEAGADPNVKDIGLNSSALLMVFSNLTGVPTAETDECAELLFQRGAIPQNPCQLFNVALQKNEHKKVNMLINYLTMLEELDKPIAKPDFHWKQLRLAIEILADSSREFLNRVVFKNLTMLNLLTDSDDKMRIHMRNNNLKSKLQQLLSDDDNKRIYPYYCSILIKRISKARRVVALEDSAIPTLSKLWNCSYNQYYNVAREVVRYLSEEDLEQLCKM